MTVTRQDYPAISDAVARAGLCARGGFRCGRDDGVPGAGDDSTLVLVGSIGRAGFDAFREAPEAGDGEPDPLDRFSERVVGALARDLGATPLYPHRGPPWLAFPRWAMRAEGLRPSPLGVLIHPRHALWHAYRGALLFPAPVTNLPRPQSAPAPCERCRDRPCLRGCPAGAFSAAGFDAGACTRYLQTAPGRRCLDTGCQARLACPVAPQLRPDPDQAAFHMAAFARQAPRPAGS